MNDRQKNESPEHPGMNDNLDNSTEQPKRQKDKRFLDVHGMRPSSSRNAKILSGARPGKE